MSYNPNAVIELGDTHSRDSFGRMRVSTPLGLFDSQFTYDLQPLLFDQVISGTNITIAHDSTNRNALLTFAATPTGGKAIMQSFAFHRYQPGKAMAINISFNFIASVASTLKFVGYSDGINGIEFQNDGTNNQFVIYSGTTNGNQTTTQANWNLDKLNGTGPSGLTLDITKAQILVMDFQALYTGRVRVGFDIGGSVIYVHQFNHSNLIIHPYIQSANLPVRAGMTCTGTVSTTMKFTCCTVISEGGEEHPGAYEYNQTVFGASTGASTNTDAHIMSIRPRATFNNIVNRTQVAMLEVNIIATSTGNVTWTLCVGQAITGTTTFNNVNATYSGVEYNTAGTISGSPTIKIDSGFLSSSNQSKGSSQMNFTNRYPITLDSGIISGTPAARANGTVSLIAQSDTANTSLNVSMKWVEIR